MLPAFPTPVERHLSIEQIRLVAERPLSLVKMSSTGPNTSGENEKALLLAVALHDSICITISRAAPELRLWPPGFSRGVI